MADRRMFSQQITSSGKFLRMPATARLLYYDLGMNADDDGIVEAYTVMAQTRANEDDLRVLVARGYVTVLNEDLVVLICHWNVNNKIRADRYKPSLYKYLKVELLESDNQVTTKWQPDNNQMTPQVRLGKDSIGKDSIGEVSRGEENPLDCPQHTKPMTDSEYESLTKKYGKNFVDQRIDRSRQYKKTCNYETIAEWCKQDWNHPRNKSKSAENYNNFPQNKYDFGALEEEFLANK